jgi:hypothetical protein
MTRAGARSRARLALAACALWLVGVEAMPALHEAMHDRLAPHHHAAGSIVTVSFEDTTHFHPDGTIHYVARAEQPAATPPVDRLDRHHDRAPQDRRVSDDADHAAGLAHHAAALAPPTAPITSPLPVDRRPSWIVVTQSRELVARDPLAATARGPPAVA